MRVQPGKRLPSHDALSPMQILICLTLIKVLLDHTFRGPSGCVVACRELATTKAVRRPHCSRRTWQTSMS